MLIFSCLKKKLSHALLGNSLTKSKSSRRITLYKYRTLVLEGLFAKKRASSKAVLPELFFPLNKFTTPRPSTCVCSKQRNRSIKSDFIISHKIFAKLKVFWDFGRIKF